jgi:transposase, IS5 family
MRVARLPIFVRKKARREYLKVSKQHKVNRQAIRKAIGKQLNYVKCNLGHIDALIAAGAS